VERSADITAPARQQRTGSIACVRQTTHNLPDWSILAAQHYLIETRCQALGGAAPRTIFQSRILFDIPDLLEQADA